MPTTTAADTVATIIPFLQPLTDAVESLVHTPPDVKAQIRTAMDGVQTGVAALAASETSAESKPIVERIEADALAVLQAAAGLPLPFPFGIILTIASSLLPTVIGAVNMLFASHVTVPTTA